ncbi:thioesterase family protein [Methylocapsa sp. S129]|uniref:acyl-CoA thioesterase n=1 Tax=Methylocapsa sp. S129 TaxID=1641869 RepID=UPI00131D3311|nr:thioesterase family protein [Methylocapsa sp. S129]
MNLRSLVWAPTISLSWFWGLGFFYSIHVTLTYGWLGFVGFAIPNALGLGLFGWIVGGRKTSPDAIVKSIEGAYGGVILLFQLAAAAITIFGFIAYFWVPMFGPGASIGAALFLLWACAIGHGLTLTAIKGLHVALLAIGLIAAALLLSALSGTTEAWSVPLASFDSRFYGLVVPTLVGFLLGPWLDIQQWQRAAAIHREGGSIRGAYAAGALFFFGLLSINALLAAAAGKVGIIISADGLPGMEGAVAFASGRLEGGLRWIGVAYVIWTALALGTTIDSSYNATRWFLATKQSRSVSAMLALIPPGVASSPLWLIAGAAAIAAAAYDANLSLMYLILPFATLFVGSAACLVCEVLGGRRLYDPILCFLIGGGAAIIFLLGYVPPIALFLTLAPLIALIGALPSIVGLFRPQQTGVAVQTLVDDSDAPSAIVALSPPEAVASHGFDGQWFVMQLMPTYDDTNSVGNIYFANYVRWVGKARELFFNICMPSFDLKITRYYVLTRSFTHDFRMEAKEFEAITVRIRISGHNRKFVTLRHEIYSASRGMLGRGEQTLMFVDTQSNRPLDIPGEIMRGFLPYWPKDSRISQKLQSDAQESSLV